MVLGKKQIEQISAFTITALAYGACTAFFGLYLTEWKPVCKFIPFFNRNILKKLASEE